MSLPDPGPAHAFRSQPVQHGRLVRLEPPASAAARPDTENPTLDFQYNPETITRTRTGRWEPRKRRRGTSAIQTPQQVRGQLGGTGASAVLAESETISFRLTFDATEAILRGGSGSSGGGGAGGGSGAAGPSEAGTGSARSTDAASVGVLRQLAFLEMVSLGREEAQRQTGPGTQTPGTEIRPIRADQLLLQLGEARIFPCVITELTITEQRFTPELVPVRAEVEIKLTVLEPVETAYEPLVRDTFNHLLTRRRDLTQGLPTASTRTLTGLLGGGPRGGGGGE